MVNLNTPYLDVHKYVRQNDKEANEMKLGKRIGAVALGTALALSIAACGGGTANKEDATEKIRAASEKVNAVESMEATMVMEMDMSVMGQKVETDTTMAMSCFNDPVKMKADMTMDMGSLGSVSMSIFAEADGDTYNMYLYDGNTWTKESSTINMLEQYDAQQSVNLYLDSGMEYIQVGTEEINGSTADKYTGVIRGEAMEEVLKASGATQNLESSLGGMVDVSDFYSDLGDMSITVWIDQQSGYPVRYYMDMTDVMQSIMSKAMDAAMGSVEGAEGIDVSGMMTIDKVVVTADCFNYNNAADFEIPAEALEA